MNIAKVGTNALTIDCTLCGNEVSHNYVDCTILDEFTLATPACTTSGCKRAGTYIPRQRPDEDTKNWAWDHNRAMNHAFARAIRKGAPVKDSLDQDTKDKLATEKGKPLGKRFANEEYRSFTSTERVKTVQEEQGG